MSLRDRLMNMTEYEAADTRMACPLRFVEDGGGAFIMGFCGSAIINMVTGYFKGPSGNRFRFMTQQVALKAPRLGLAFGVWGTLFATFECIIMRVRGKEDMGNTVISGALVSALLASRSGPKAIFNSFLVGGFIMSVIEGLMHVMQSVLSPVDGTVNLKYPTDSQRKSFLDNINFQSHLETLKEKDELKEAYDRYALSNTPTFSSTYLKHLVFGTPVTAVKNEVPSEDADLQHEMVVNMMRASSAVSAPSI